MRVPLSQGDSGIASFAMPQGVPKRNLTGDAWEPPEASQKTRCFSPPDSGLTQGGKPSLSSSAFPNFLRSKWPRTQPRCLVKWCTKGGTKKEVSFLRQRRKALPHSPFKDVRAGVTPGRDVSPEQSRQSPAYRTAGKVAGLAVLMHCGCPNPPALFPVPPLGFSVMS